MNIHFTIACFPRATLLLFYGLPVKTQVTGQDHKSHDQQTKETNKSQEKSSNLQQTKESHKSENKASNPPQPKEAPRSSFACPWKGYALVAHNQIARKDIFLETLVSERRTPKPKTLKDFEC